MKKAIPDYKKIYTDILRKKFPNKAEKTNIILKKNELSSLDVITLNNLIFNENNKTNQKHRSYRKADILKILDYQRKNELNNQQLAIHFKLSRNTIAKWKKLFL